MPHLLIEYSQNLAARTDLEQLLHALHNCAIGTGVLPKGGLRTRLLPREQYLIADSHEDNGFVHLLLRLAAGRSIEQKRQVGDALFDCATQKLAPVFQRWPIALSLEIQEIDPDWRWKKNNIRDFLAQRDT